MDPRLPPALDYSCADAWMDSHGALSDALGAIAFVQPALSRLSARWGFGQPEPTLFLDTPRRARLPAAQMPLSSALPTALASAVPALGEPAAASLSALLLLAAPLAAACSDGAFDWARCLHMDSLGLGSSARFDPNFPDGLERDAPDGLAEAERAFTALAHSFPQLALSALLVGTRQLDGPARAVCAELLAIFEADGIDAVSAKPSPNRPVGAAPPRDRLRI